ncbi:hypothetical protein NCG97_18715 [Streptomyces lydicamycinicus]|uniref:hypothetical protein n=1 Tax=Streptomyces lydicamycinicus TaxID=1546107 RepID=UPI0020351B76|nr:hypothetical protein [Streptomyces lydicamycinicus]USA02235.1 hypothetical protein NCG97_18715 [Streptomyces lydicamycinicus]
MTEYSWPDHGTGAAARVREAWDRTVADLPAGTPVTGEVIGRRPFGVFLRIDGHPDAVGLAEAVRMPGCGTLPLMGERVSGEVIWHAAHHHQVKIELTEWAGHEDRLSARSARPAGRET